MFVDTAKVIIRAGGGGNGVVSFRHEKFVDRGGPDGGDGGNGGDIILVASRNQNTLANFRFQKEIVAENGHNGSKRRRHGKAGQDLLVNIPVGTAILSDDGTVLADLTQDGQRAIIARGGKGGYGNAHFVNSTRQAPRIAEKGELGDELIVVFELKSIADVGLVGLPNAGKSTFLSVVSNARPEIADYPFTTLTPNLGVAAVDKQTSLLFADVPGLIEGASKGKGLGVEFLRHVERTSVILHLIDIREDVVKAYKTITNELKEYTVDLTNKPQVVALSKIDGIDQKVIDAKKKELSKNVPKGTKIFEISSVSHIGLKPLLYNLNDLVRTERITLVQKGEDKLPVISLPDTDTAWHVTATGSSFIVTGRKIEKFAQRTDFDNPAGVERLRDIMRKMGIMHDLQRKGINPGQKVKIGDHSIEY